MGKDLKGKELGVGISQRKDGLYTARFTDRRGKRRQKYFKKLQECRKWIADAQFEDEHGDALRDENPTVDTWYHYWMDSVKGDNIRYNTKRIYNDGYNRNIKPLIGDMFLKDVKPMHCQNVLNQMAEAYSDSVITICRLIMKMLFDCAAENELILKNPVTRNVKCASWKETKVRQALTTLEQKRFLEQILGTDKYNQYALVLQTGLRTGEMTGLRWADVDLINKKLFVRRTMEYNRSTREWRTGDPKSKTSVREIPLTQEAVRILTNQKEKLKSLKVRSIEFTDSVFLGSDGTPIKNDAYDKTLIRHCDRIGIRRFSMHVLRHTFATRCIEAGMKPKTLQMILGHSDISMTMNLYVHVTGEEKEKEMQNIEGMLKVI